MIRPIRKPVFESILPCDGCVECCKREMLFLHPEWGDDPEQYETQTVMGRAALAQADNGDCIYLDREAGCTIWDRRPALCRELDCRVWLTIPRRRRQKMIARGLIRKSQIRAARALERRMA